MKEKSRFSHWLPILCLVFSACSPQPGPKTKDIVSANGKLRITVPAAWQEKKGLNDSADLQAAYTPSEMYVVVLSEPKEDLQDMTLDQHSKLTREALLTGVKDPVVTGPFAVQVDGRPAVQYEIRGGVDHVKVVYLHVTVDGLKYYHQILAWTVPSRFEANKPTLEGVVQRFKELP
ncbi:MAG: hypothetical protein IT572_00230 [Deltaproteobacteria bacterium]|nr:hypothetical protein [Deltaproteobacteria bacterium]